MFCLHSRFREYPRLDNDVWTHAYHMKHYFDQKHGASRQVGGDTVSIESAAETEVMSDADIWNNCWGDHDENELSKKFRVSCTRKKTEHYPSHKFSSLEVMRNKQCSIFEAHSGKQKQ
jgi:hypothetical protein